MATLANIHIVNKQKAYSVEDSTLTVIHLPSEDHTELGRFEDP